MKKRILALALGCVLCLGLMVSAFAANETVWVTLMTASGALKSTYQVTLVDGKLSEADRAAAIAAGGPGCHLYRDENTDLLADTPVVSPSPSVSPSPTPTPSPSVPPVIGDLAVDSIGTELTFYAKVQVSGMKSDKFYIVKIANTSNQNDESNIQLVVKGEEVQDQNGTYTVYAQPGRNVWVFEFASMDELAHFSPRPTNVPHEVAEIKPIQ